MTLWASGYRNLLANRRRMMEAGVSSGQSYIEKVVGYGPIAYWPLNEASGLVANCLVNPLQNGVYTGVTLGQPGIGDGNTCPLFDGANDYVNVMTATFAAALNGSEGTVSTWLRAFNAGVWTDGSARKAFRFRVDGANYIFMQRGAGNNIFRSDYSAGGTADNVNDSLSTTDWFHSALTWSATNNEIELFTGGISQGVSLGLGVWAGPIILALIGASFITGEVWHGWEQHFAVFGSVLTQPQIADLATV